MNAWMKRIIVSLAVLVLAACATRLAWELLSPAVPALIALLVAFVIFQHVLRGPKGW